MLKFSAKDLKPVLLEARKNHCGVVLVKDHGIYIMSETGEITPRGRKVAYAKGCHPEKDEAFFAQVMNICSIASAVDLAGRKP